MFLYFLAKNPLKSLSQKKDDFSAEIEKLCNTNKVTGCFFWCDQFTKDFPLRESEARATLKWLSD